MEQTFNSRPMTYLSDENNDEAITPSHLLYGRNISKRNIMHIDYREHTAENTQQQYKRVKFIINHFNNRFYEEYELSVNDVVLIQEENQPRVKWRKGKISKLINSKDSLVRGVELVVNKGMSIKANTIRKPVQHLIPLEMSRDCKNEVSIELNKSQEEPVEELAQCNDTDWDFEKREQNSGY